MVDPLPLVAPLTEVYRGDLVESRHRGAVVLADATGRATHWVGDGAFRTFWRSSAKPLQALPAIVTGAVDHFGLEERHIAIMFGSHVGKESPSWSHSWLAPYATSTARSSARCARALP